jgi:hypothetical protein
MTEQDNRPSDTRTRTGWRRLQISGELSGTTSPVRQSERFVLDYATWRAHIAAPGSRFDSAPSTFPRIIRLDAASRQAAAAADERRTA